MAAAGREWIEGLPDELSGQRRLLLGLLAFCEADPDVAWLLVGCSLARGAADRLSDLDVGIGVDGEDFAAACARVRQAVDGLGDLVDRFEHQIPGLSIRHERVFAQYADRTQIDLVVAPANPNDGFASGVALYDPHGRLKPVEAPAVTPTVAREWAFLACCALADLGKYLRRRSPWEALARLDEARTQLWRLLAAAEGVRDPQYGITSLLDFAPDRVPAEMAHTVSDLDPSRLLSAARQLVALLRAAGARWPDAFPDAMVRYVAGDLASLAEQGV